MKKIELGQAIAIVANVGVIAGIVFLGIEIRNANTHARTSTILSVIELQSDWLYELSLDEESSEIYLKGMAGFDALSPEERGRFDLLIRSYLMRLESGRQAQSFGLGPEGSTFEERIVTDLVSKHGFIEWWNSANLDLIPGPMRALIASTVAQVE